MAGTFRVYLPITESQTELGFKSQLPLLTFFNVINSMANKAETRLWLRANIVPLKREVGNQDGSKRTTLETLLKLIESVAVDQHADHIIALMQEQQVGFRVRDGAEAMINAVRKFLKNDTNRILMQGDIANAYGSINRLLVLKAVRKHIPCLAPLCASQFVRDGTVAVIQERGGNGKKCELHNSVAKGVWQWSTLSSATFFLTFWNKMTEVMEQANRERLVMNLISYADDFTVSSDGDEAVRVRDETTDGLGEIGLEIDQSKSCYTSKTKIGWNHKTLAIKKEIVVLGTEATEWLMTSKSIARSVDFDAKVVNSKKMKTLAETLEAKNEMHLRKFAGESTRRRRLDQNETADKPRWDGHQDSVIAAGNFV